MKNFSVLIALTLLIAGCVEENSDGSSKSTYSSCAIIESSALFAADRANDLNQCWDGVDYKEKSLALNWCTQKVNTYIASRYTFGHSVKYQVTSTNCP